MRSPKKQTTDANWCGVWLLAMLVFGWILTAQVAAQGLGGIQPGKERAPASNLASKP